MAHICEQCFRIRSYCNFCGIKMENRVLVSVIIPVFNVRPYLEEALDSAIHQTYQNIEIIIIDDGSTDGSSEICDEYAEKDKRVLVIHQENRGLSAARNKGLDIMKGEMVAFLDSDDAYCPDFIASMIETMNCDKADIAICKYSLYHTSGMMDPYKKSLSLPSIKEGIYDRTAALSALADRTINHSVWNKLYRRHLWKEIRFPEGCVYEDVDVTFRIIDLCRTISVSNRVLYLYRKRSGSILTIRSLKNNYDWVMTHDHFEEFIRTNTPAIFSEEQLRQNKLVWGKELLHWYGYLTWKKKDEWIESSNYLRKQIIDSPECFAVPTVIGYWMVRYCPLLYRTTYLGLAYLRQLAKWASKNKVDAP